MQSGCLWGGFSRLWCCYFLAVLLTLLLTGGRPSAGVSVLPPVAPVTSSDSYLERRRRLMATTTKLLYSFEREMWLAAATSASRQDSTAVLFICQDSKPVPVVITSIVRMVLRILFHFLPQLVEKVEDGVELGMLPIRVALPNFSERAVLPMECLTTCFPP